MFAGKVTPSGFDLADRQKQPARHRLVYDLLKDEMTPPEGTIHALQMTLKTDEEIQAAAAKAQANISS